MLEVVLSSAARAAFDGRVLEIFWRQDVDAGNLAQVQQLVAAVQQARAAA